MKQKQAEPTKPIQPILTPHQRMLESHRQAKQLRHDNHIARRYNLIQIPILLR